MDEVLKKCEIDGSGAFIGRKQKRRNRVMRV